MSAALRSAEPMSREQFLDWVQRQETRFEFDGEGPVPMQGASINHNLLGFNIQAALRRRLRAPSWVVVGPDAGVATTGRRVRYPDVVVMGGPVDGTALLAPAPAVVFEIVSPGSERMDRVVKAREYLGVPSIATYVIVEQRFAGVTALHRDGETWRAVPLGGRDTLELPPLGIAVPLAELYEGTDLPEPDEDGAPSES